MNAANPIPFNPEGPQPLLREIPAGAAYPVAALGPLRPAVEAVQGFTQAPVAIPAASALAVASLAVQGFADVETLGGFAPVSLYFLTIAQSGERKSSCDKPLLLGLREYEREQSEVYAAAFKTWANASELHDAKKKGALRDAVSANPDKRMAAEADLAALGDAPDGPILPDRTASEPTLEGLFRAFLQGQPSLGLFSDEAGQFLGGHAMNADNRMKTLGGLNSLWDGSEIKRTRAGDGVFTLRGRRMALHLMAQPVVMHGFISDPLASGLGFLPRCLMCEPASSIGQRLSANMRRDDGALAACRTGRIPRFDRRPRAWKWWLTTASGMKRYGVDVLRGWMPRKHPIIRPGSAERTFRLARSGQTSVSCSMPRSPVSTRPEHYRAPAAGIGGIPSPI